MLRLKTSNLVWAVIGLNVLFLILIVMLDYDAGWDWGNFAYTGFWTPTGLVRNLFFNGWHPVIPWLSFLLLGVILSRVSLAAQSTQLGLLVGGALALGFAEGLSVFLIPTMAIIDPELSALFTTEPVPPGLLYMLAGSGAACLVIGICLLSADRLRGMGILQIVVPAGRQTLTLYIAHILIGMGTLEALGLLSDQTVNQAVWASLLFCSVALLMPYSRQRSATDVPASACLRMATI